MPMVKRRKASKRLERLVRCGLCEGKDATQYAAELEKLAAGIMDPELTGRQTKFFKALGDRTRLRILKLLKAREMCVCEVMTALNLTQPTASHHLHVLEDAGLVRNRREGKWVFYSLTNPELVETIAKLDSKQ